MRIAIIENEKVINVIDGDESLVIDFPYMCKQCKKEVGIGWSYDFTNEKFIEPVSNVPLPEETVAAYRARVNPTLPEGLPEPYEGELVVDFRRRVAELNNKK